MSTLDIVLLVILGAFTASGLFKGLIRLLGRIVGLIIGAYVASNFYLLFFEWGRQWVVGRENLGKILAFIILFVVVTRLVDFIFFLIEKIFNFIAVIPGSKYLNNLLGGALGLLEGSLFLGLVFYVITRYPLASSLFNDQLANSLVIPWLLKVTTIVLPILPGALRALRSII